MMTPLRADQVNIARLTADRPGGIQSFMTPTRLNNQVNVSAGVTDLVMTPVGKNLVGDTQWSIAVKRPGLAQPLIVAKADQKALAKVAQVMQKRIK